MGKKIMFPSAFKKESFIFIFLHFWQSTDLFKKEDIIPTSKIFMIGHAIL